MSICFQEIKNIDPTDKSNWGHKAWKMFNELCGQIPCPTCKKHCYDMIKFEHDLVNLHTGKPLYDEQHFNKYLKMINEYSDNKMVYYK
jgi:hypothetical protein